MKYKYIGYHKTNINGNTIKTNEMIELKSLKNLNPNEWIEMKETQIKKQKGDK